MNLLWRMREVVQGLPTHKASEWAERPQLDGPHYGTGSGLQQDMWQHKRESLDKDVWASERAALAQDRIRTFPPAIAERREYILKRLNGGLHFDE